MFATLVEAVCTLYAYAPLLHALGGHVVSTDEMTGVQALQRKHPCLPMSMGKVARREHEYIRHGTRAFMINFDVVTGQVMCPSHGSTRTEADFVAHVRRTVASDPGATSGILWLTISTYTVLRAWCATSPN